ncbi:MAG TPA: pyridoxamine 5'-phosphate oxidase family protein [Candidatus Binataceae bacterium]|nr:pyridoxamine 5'-phosphate oxidase family protein [Candidatus Binataceae bacterium]
MTRLTPEGKGSAGSQDLQSLQKLIDRSVASAGPAAADSLAYPARQMSAAEFVEFWQSVRRVAMATAGENGSPHIAPVHARLDGIRLRLVIYDNTLRRRDIAVNPKVAFTAWRADGATAIVYGVAREVAGSLRPARAAQSGKARQVVELEVELTRIYAMRPPERAA